MRSRQQTPPLEAFALIDDPIHQTVCILIMEQMHGHPTTPQPSLSESVSEQLLIATFQQGRLLLLVLDLKIPVFNGH